nr:MAG TPA: hypothetical protein [Microviridae sp.]
MKGLDQRYLWVVTNEKFEKALKASKAKRNCRVIPSPFFFGTMTFSSEQDLQDFFYSRLSYYFENWTHRHALYFGFAAAELMLAHEYVKQYLRPFEHRYVQMNVEDVKHVPES